MSVESYPSPAALRDALYELSLAAERPDTKLLDEFVRRYPEYAAELTDFAIDVIADLNRRDKSEACDVATQVSPAVSRAVSKYHNALHSRARGEAKPAAAGAALAVECENPFASLDRARFRSLAGVLNVSLVFLCKLRDCLIDPATMTEGFRRYLAEKMNISMERLAGFLAGMVPRLDGQFFKADQKPEAASQQSFEEAVRSSGLSQSQQDFLLGL
jgi:hypothetical protein